MKILGFDIRRAAGSSAGAPASAEARMITSITGGALERPNGGDILSIVGLGDIHGPCSVSIAEALTVPAFWAGSTFLSRTLAALPLHAYRRGANGSAERISGGLETIVHEAPNPEWTSYGWRKYHWQQVFTGGRGVSWIERSGSNIVGIWPMDPRRTKVTRKDGRKLYTFGSKTYPAADVIDTTFMLGEDQLCAYGPVTKGAKALRRWLDMDAYARGFFRGGGVPPLALVGPLPAGPDGMRRAMADVSTAIEQARNSDKPIFQIPPGYKLEQVGFDPAKGQMTEAARQVIEELARLLNLPPMFVGDLTKGNFANTEQQDLHLVKHVVGQHAADFEQECNLKLFGQMNGRRWVEHNLDGLMRGDLLTRMQAFAAGINTAQITPDEVRKLENRPSKPGGDQLFIQGATVPLGSSPSPAAPEPDPADPSADA